MQQSDILFVSEREVSATEVGPRGPSSSTGTLAPSVRVVLETLLANKTFHVTLLRSGIWVHILADHEWSPHGRFPRRRWWRIECDWRIVWNLAPKILNHLLSYETSFMNHSSLFPTDSRDGLLNASDAGWRSRLKLPVMMFIHLTSQQNGEPVKL